MRILVSCIPYDGGRSGISEYVREVVRELRAQGHELTLLCEDSSVAQQLLELPPRPQPALPPNHITAELPDSRTILAPRWTRRPVFSMLWHLTFLPIWIRRHRREFDGFVICAANRRVCASYPLPTVATIHDLANFHIPGKYSRLRMFYLAHVLPRYAKRAQRLVAVSGATKSDMVDFWHCRESDVTVLYNGLAHSPLPAPRSPFPVPSSLLYISRIEHPGKNHVRLIEAYGRLDRQLASRHPLVLAGADWKDAEVVHEAVAKCPNSEFIRVTGFVPESEMARLWEETGFYVFPSLFEGFGLSLADAMARGIPCACSENGSLGEVGGDAAVKFDPYDVGSIADALVTLLTESEDSRKARIARGLERVKAFSWKDHAAGIVKLLEEPLVARLFGIPVARLTESQAVERIVSIAKSAHSPAPAPRSPYFVATLNVDFVTNAVRGWPFGGNDELWGYLRGADLVTADGMPIVLLSKLLRRPIPERVTGADMVPAICRRFAEEGLSVYVLGGSQPALDEAFAKLPNVRVAGLDPAFVKLDEDQTEIVERINAAKPDILFVALGNPKQELWMGRNAPRLKVPVMIGIGGTFNFIAGHVKRAPRWMQRCGLEWIYRILQEPGRLWRRYAFGLVKYSWLSLIHLFGGYRK